MTDNIDTSACVQMQVNLMQQDSRCNKTSCCDEQYNICLERHLDKYIGNGKPAVNQIIAAMLSPGDINSSTFFSALHLNHRRNINKAIKRNYFCKPFAYLQYTPDIYAINTSKVIRTGRAMSAQYLRSVDELGGAPEYALPFKKPSCPLHYDYWWGVFIESKGHLQGAVQVDEQLVGYVKLRRNGDYAFYSQILGHGDYLNAGIMHLLHYEIVSWVLHQIEPEAKGLTKLIYAGYYQGLDGLREWKKRALFQPALLYTPQI